ncbi:hypothetical protein K402DRAFT_400580 [Aulographum hederae CBS 113979]|uniref:Tautomerase cis-CaaD-like domain-containing protein n=1 Tax=Aulographum hederae CBS 113979 TaxID=1176131 RepID=A0A6G1HD08_9PEZI|nr:hypothetical protein K402DRAFT_400580 [Aulographum hederae CBS 113979]
MPLWRIYHPEGTFTTPAHKKGLADGITKLYETIGLPAFYVVVLFIPLKTTDMFVGGSNRPPPPLTDASGHHIGLPVPSFWADPKAAAEEPQAPFIRIFASNIARKMKDDGMKGMFRERVNQLLQPWVKDWGYDWEWHADETDRELWEIEGVSPPLPGEEGQWHEAGRPIPQVKEVKL